MAAIKGEDDEQWYLDTGCSNHMSGKKNWFYINLKESSKRKIGFSYNIIGSGTKGKVDKIEKHSNILKEKLYYLNDSMLDSLNVPKHLVVSLIYTTLGRVYITN
ncbi:hypothetical protein MTR_1g031260 [Medicago truncatula]|uniref:Retrovirus-related Pol polyprotein from transposon TNT 1-94-like beta-barrel domain-containing protein n=1 Tax=Medicago truncatula TaxID=3880 RepID=G7I956_MEDTR|nr:hypothetical protein MTR_1g031260 [Medicago truncatula]